MLVHTLRDATRARPSRQDAEGYWHGIRPRLDSDGLTSAVVGACPAFSWLGGSDGAAGERCCHYFPRYGGCWDVLAQMAQLNDAAPQASADAAAGGDSETVVGGGDPAALLERIASATARVLLLDEEPETLLRVGDADVPQAAVGIVNSWADEECDLSAARLLQL